jgi:caa(3)-type oxidase subunit IV
MSLSKPSVGYLTIWMWLMALLAIGVVLLAIPSKTLAVFLIFTVAAVKAFLVLRHYMHVRHQPVMIYLMLGIPVLLAIAFTIVLLPDIAFR